MQGDDTTPPGYTAQTMTMRDALASPHAATRDAAGARLREGAAQAVVMAIEAYGKACLDEEITIFRANVH